MECKTAPPRPTSRLTRSYRQLALQGGEVLSRISLSSGYVFFPKGSYREVEFLLVLNQETG